MQAHHLTNQNKEKRGTICKQIYPILLINPNTLEYQERETNLPVRREDVENLQRIFPVFKSTAMEKKMALLRNLLNELTILNEPLETPETNKKLKHIFLKSIPTRLSRMEGIKATDYLSQDLLKAILTEIGRMIFNFVHLLVPKVSAKNRTGTILHYLCSLIGSNNPDHFVILRASFYYHNNNENPSLIKTNDAALSKEKNKKRKRENVIVHPEQGRNSFGDFTLTKPIHSKKHKSNNEAEKNQTQIENNLAPSQLTFQHAEDQEFIELLSAEKYTDCQKRINEGKIYEFPKIIQFLHEKIEHLTRSIEENENKNKNKTMGLFSSAQIDQAELAKEKKQLDAYCSIRTVIWATHVFYYHES